MLAMEIVLLLDWTMNVKPFRSLNNQTYVYRDAKQIMLDFTFPWRPQMSEGEPTESRSASVYSTRSGIEFWVR
jgi:hypothetical protein